MLGSPRQLFSALWQVVSNIVQWSFVLWAVTLSTTTVVRESFSTLVSQAIFLSLGLQNNNNKKWHGLLNEEVGSHTEEEVFISFCHCTEVKAEMYIY